MSHRGRLIPLTATGLAVVIGVVTGALRAAEPAGLKIEFANRELQLAGLLRLPATPPPHPAVVLIGGSAPLSASDAGLGDLAGAFVAAGFAALATDSRGVGGSAGEFASASFEDLAADAAAAAEALRARPDIRRAAVGIVGKSQGGTWVGPLAAARAGAAFLVSLSGPLDSPEDYMHGVLAGRLRDQGLAEADVERVTAARRRLWSYMAAASEEGFHETEQAIAALRAEPWFAQAGLPGAVRKPADLADMPAGTRVFLEQRGFDPLAALAGLRCPVLAVYGEGDAQMPVARYATALRALAGGRITVLVAPGLDHDLREPGAAALSARALEPVTRWSAERAAARPTAPRR